MITVLVLAYAVAAAGFAAHALFSAVARTRGERLFTRLILAATALLAGALWILFTPGLLVHVGRLGSRRFRPAVHSGVGWRLRSGMHAHP